MKASERLRYDQWLWACKQARFFRALQAERGVEGLAGWPDAKIVTAIAADLTVKYELGDEDYRESLEIPAWVRATAERALAYARTPQD